MVNWFFLLLPVFLSSWFFTKSFASNNHLNKHANGRRNPVKAQSPQHHLLILQASDVANHSRQRPPKSNHLKDEQDIFLRIKSDLKDINATSGAEASFKCKVDGNPKKNIQYIWYHNNLKISSEKDRFIISLRPWGSKLLIRNLYTFDSGIYRCEASNGLRRVHSNAKLQVFFELPPSPSSEEKVKINLPRGKCKVYQGSVCKKYFGKYGIYVEEFEDQDKMEDVIKAVITSLGSASEKKESSSQCRFYALPAFCYYIFRPCIPGTAGSIQRAERLCREDCESLKRDVCNKEYLNMNTNLFFKNHSSSADCSFLPSISTGNCKTLNFSQSESSKKPADDEADECYLGNGKEYEGTVHVTESGKNCSSWPKHMAIKDFHQMTNHNYCRNPDALMHKPWCYVDDSVEQKMPCKIKQCSTGGSRHNTTNLLVIILSCSAAFLCFVILMAFCCLRRRHRSKNATKLSKISTFQLDSKRPVYATVNSSLPHLNVSSIRLLAEIGHGKYGNVYKGAIVDDIRFGQNEPYAIVVLKDNYATSHLEQFRREMNVLAELQHPHVASLKAVVNEVSFHCMVFQYTEQVDLHEYLMLNSPNRNTAKRCNTREPNNCYPSLSTIDNFDFMEMAVQVASGMEYLTNGNYIHKDLAARNVLVCGNMNLKISDFGAMRESYISCYHTTPQGKVVPLRWMAPESLHIWEFTDKSTVWSFGVLLWEMFSYGLQPYCGYSNHEVLDMISGRQLLTCPDQCPAKIYVLMQECWALLPKNRPTFQEAQDKLRLCMEAGEVTIVQSAYLNRGQIVTAPSPPPEYQSYCSNRYQDQSMAASWIGNGTPSERSFLSTTSNGCHSNSLNKTTRRFQQPRFMTGETSFPIDTLMENV